MHTHIRRIPPPMGLQETACLGGQEPEAVRTGGRVTFHYTFLYLKLFYHFPKNKYNLKENVIHNPHPTGWSLPYPSHPFKALRRGSSASPSPCLSAYFQNENWDLRPGLHEVSRISKLGLSPPHPTQLPDPHLLTHPLGCPGYQGSFQRQRLL